MLHIKSFLPKSLGTFSRTSMTFCITVVWIWNRVEVKVLVIMIDVSTAYKHFLAMF